MVSGILFVIIFLIFFVAFVAYILKHRKNWKNKGGDSMFNPATNLDILPDDYGDTTGNSDIQRDD